MRVSINIKQPVRHVCQESVLIISTPRQWLAKLGIYWHTVQLEQGGQIICTGQQFESSFAIKSSGKFQHQSRRRLMKNSFILRFSLVIEVIQNEDTWILRTVLGGLSTVKENLHQGLTDSSALKQRAQTPSSRSSLSAILRRKKSKRVF